MRDSDLAPFVGTFTRLRRIFPAFKSNPTETQHTAEEYFRVMSNYPLGAVDAGADAWIEKGEHFPKPAEWMKSIPKQQSASYPVMVDPEASEQRRAMQLWYQDDPCSCHACKRADVTHRMLRFVPEEDRDGGDLRMLLDGKVVVKGHWAHGDELKRWYEARDNYLGLRSKYAPRLMKRMPKVSQRQIEAEDRSRYGVDTPLAEVESVAAQAKDGE